jgi:hypothetical protein
MAQQSQVLLAQLYTAVACCALASCCTNFVPCSFMQSAHAYSTVCALLLLFMQLPKLMELVGLGYTSWFIYRYLLFKVRALQHKLPYISRSWQQAQQIQQATACCCSWHVQGRQLWVVWQYDAISGCWDVSST